MRVWVCKRGSVPAIAPSDSLSHGTIEPIGHREDLFIGGRPAIMIPRQQVARVSSYRPSRRRLKISTSCASSVNVGNQRNFYSGCTRQCYDLLLVDSSSVEQNAPDWRLSMSHC